LPLAGADEGGHGSSRPPSVQSHSERTGPPPFRFLIAIPLYQGSPVPGIRSDRKFTSHFLVVNLEELWLRSQEC
jgi:hypothetical protein